MRFVTPSIAAVALLCASSSFAATIIGPVVNPANSHSYYLLNSKAWSASEAEAVQLGGHLTTINDAAEQAWVQSTFGVNRNLWIGLYNPSHDTNAATHAANYAWSSGEAINYLNWSPNEPNNVTFEYWVHTWGDTTDMAAYPPSVRPAGAWNNIIDSGVYAGSVHGPYGVVEVIPEPGSMAAFGIICVFATRRAVRRN